MNCLDTRDLNSRLEELESELEDLQDQLENATDDAENADSPEDRAQARTDAAAVEKELAAWKEENQEELEELQNLRDEVGSEWPHSETLIPVDDFTEYVEELLKDCGYLPQDLPDWIVIDWEATAENIKVDYSEADYQGTTYLFRSC